MLVKIDSLEGVWKERGSLIVPDDVRAITFDDNHFLVLHNGFYYKYVVGNEINSIEIGRRNVPKIDWDSFNFNR